MQVTELKRRIFDAFQQGEMPSAVTEVLSAPTDHYEFATLYPILRYKSWDQIPRHVLHTDAAFILPSPVFEYFLPAFLLAVLDNDEWSGTVWEFLSNRIAPPMKRTSQKNYFDYFIYSQVQLEAIRCFFEFMISKCETSRSSKRMHGVLERQPFYNAS